MCVWDAKLWCCSMVCGDTCKANASSRIRSSNGTWTQSTSNRHFVLQKSMADTRMAQAIVLCEDYAWMARRLLLFRPPLQRAGNIAHALGRLRNDTLLHC
jgi:hypothetical protein